MLKVSGNVDLEKLTFDVGPAYPDIRVRAMPYALMPDDGGHYNSTNTPFSTTALKFFLESKPGSLGYN